MTGTAISILILNQNNVKNKKALPDNIRGVLIMQSEKEKQEQMQRGYYETALLTRKERDWLLGKLDLSKSYEYRLKSSIKKKIQTFVNRELPLLIKNNLIVSYEPENLGTEFGDGTHYNDNSSLGKAKVPVLLQKDICHPS
jgi:hypothetical protein